jgi:hypothetical protein
VTDLGLRLLYEPIINLKSAKILRPKRLFIAGSFDREINRKKREFCLNSVEARKHFDTLHIFNANESNHINVDGFEEEFFPLWLFNTKKDSGRLIEGLFVFFTLIFSSPQVLREVLILEFKALPFRFKWKRKRLKRIFRMLVRGICGLGQVSRVFRRFSFCDGDTVIVWSEHMSGIRLLKREVRRSGGRLIFSEYGELPGTTFICDCGLFHESWPLRYKEKFSALPISSDEIAEMAKYLENIVNKRISSKVGQYASDLTFDALKVQKGKPIIYINGAQSQASGLLPRCSSFSKEYSPYFASNEAMLKYFSKLAEKHDWTILYKDHPNTCNYFPGRKLRDGAWGGHVKILENIDIYEILVLADLTVSLGSKTVCLSLLNQVPVLLMGPYSINPDNLSSGVYTSDDCEETIISAVQSARRDGVDGDEVTEYFTRMMKYYYYSMDDDAESLFGRGRQQFWKDFLDYMSGGRSVISAKVNIKKLNN